MWRERRGVGKGEGAGCGRSFLTWSFCVQFQSSLDEQEDGVCLVHGQVGEVFVGWEARSWQEVGVSGLIPEGMLSWPVEQGLPSILVHAVST